ncbi:MAG: hypothetical protein ACRCVI_00840 [Mycoplasmoidaceae bacterium]
MDNFLHRVFLEIKENKQKYCIAINGESFEDSFKKLLREYEFTAILKQDQLKEIIEREMLSQKEAKAIWKDLKIKILEKNSSDLISNPFKKIQCDYIHQPNGSQNYPDFIVFFKSKVIPIEIKYSKSSKRIVNLNSKKPMWNSNLPKPNGIYIYGVSNFDVTFFKGEDVLNYDTRNLLINFFNELNAGEKIFEEKLSKLDNPFGFYPYIRRAYQQNNKFSTFKNEKKIKRVQSFFSDEREIREENVLKLIKKIDE